MRLMRRPHETAPTRKVVIAALALLVLGTVGAVKAGIAGASFSFDLEQVTPALARSAPAIEEPGTPRLARRVFVVIIDGLGLNHSYQLPFLDELRRRGVDTEAVSHYPSFSRPNYVSILTGVPPSASGVRTNHHLTAVQLDSLMDRAHAAGMHTASATDVTPLPRLFLRPRTALSAIPPIEIDRELHSTEEQFTTAAVRYPDADLVSPFDDARYTPWPGGFSEAGAALAAGDAELVVMIVTVVDEAGHAYGAASRQYRQAAEIADRALARALGRVDLTQDAIVITADHGHTARGGHGGTEPEVMSVPLIVVGAGVRPGATSPDARLADLAPTVSALLGIPAPGHGLGRTLTELLTLDDSARVRRTVADNLRLISTRSVVAAAEARADLDVLEHRAARIAFVVAGTLFATVLAVLLRRRHVMRFDLRILAIAAPAFFVVYFALIATVGQRFSPSLVPAQGHLASALIRYGLVATLVQLLASLWALSKQPTLGTRLAMANGLAWVGFMLAMVPAALVWAFFPPPYVSVPSPYWLVLIPALEVGVACAALSFALTLAVEVVIFASRAWHQAPPPID